VKNCVRIAADFASNEASSAEVPQKPKFRLNKKFLFFTASALIFCASLGLAQSVKAAGTLTVADIKAALGGLPQAVNSEQSGQPHQQYAGDEALSALSSFAQQIGAQTPKPASAKTAVNSDRQFDDQAYSALQDFAQRLGTAQPESIKAQPKLAEADNLFDALRGFNGATPQTSPSAAAPNGPVAGGKRSRAPVEATFVGAKTCLTCHSSQTEAFGKTLMGRIGKTQKGKFDCENCHGPGSAHVKAGGGRGVGGIISFRPEDQSRTAEENNAVCLTCHEKGDRTYWNGSTHETRGLMCTNCHTIMKEVSRKRQLKTAFEADTCFQCHKDRRAQMARSSHMPLREGKITCSNCHNPHGSFTEALLRENSINDTCYKCHAEKRGPFLIEHAPVRENCLNCHDPHGSVNEYLLKVSRPKLCFECHGFGHGGTAGPAQVQAIGRSCQNCHNAVHGTNSAQPLLHK
jgi:DmsE family decaheme c-type cytochrome